MDAQKQLQQSSDFSFLSDTDAAAFVAQLELCTFDFGETLVAEETPCDAVYLIKDGQARVSLKAHKKSALTVNKLSAGELVGEDAFIQMQAHACSIRAASTLEAWKIPLPFFELFLNKHSTFKEQLTVRALQRQKSYFLRKHPLLEKLNLPEFQALSEIAEHRVYSKNQMITSPEHPEHGLFLVYSGQVAWFDKANDHQAFLHSSVNTAIGIESLLETQMDNYIQASEDVEVLFFSKNDLLAQPFWSKVQPAFESLAQQQVLRKKSLVSSQQPQEKRRNVPKLQLSQSSFQKGFWKRSYPLVKTEHPVLMGMACLSMVNAYYQRSNHLEPLVEQRLLDRQQDTLYSLSRHADQEGYLSRLLYCETHQLFQIQLPAIVSLRGGMTAVIYEVNKDGVLLADPLSCIEFIPWDTFEKIWEGQALTIGVEPSFGSHKQASSLAYKLLHLAKPYWGLLAWIGFFSLTLQLAGLVSPFFTQTIIDRVLPSNDYSLLGLMLISMMIITLFNLASASMRELLVSHTIRRISALILVRFLKHVLSLQQMMYQQWRIGDVTTRFQENEKFLRLVSHSGYQAIVDSLSIVVYLVVLVQMNADLAMIGVGFASVYGILMFVASPILRENDRRVFEFYRQAESKLIETISQIESIKAMAVESTNVQEGQKVFQSLKKAELRGGILSLNLSIVGQFIQSTSVLVVLSYGAMLTLEGDISVGELIAFNLVLGLLLAPLKSLVEVWDEIQEVRISFERINDILKQPIEPEHPEALLPPIEGDIVFEKVSVQYSQDDKPALNEIELHIPAKQTVAFVGKSGAGKTTLSNLVTHLVTPSEGRVLIDNQDLQTVDLTSLRRQVGVVEQTPFLFHGTIRENIIRAHPDLAFEKVVAAAKIAGIHELIEELPMGYDTQVGERGILLSGGQRQRLAIARALVGDPKILVFDEATSALDSETEKLIQQNLIPFLQTRTTLLITHRLATAKQADRIIVLDKGHLLEDGTHDELLKLNGIYAQLWRLQMGDLPTQETKSDSK